MLHEGTMKSLLQGILVSISSLLLLFATLELTFRTLGYSTPKFATFQMRGTKMEPKPLFNPDTLVGLKLDSGTFKIYYEDGAYWRCTNDRKGNRITSRDSLPNIEPYKHIDIFGCSFSYGTGLSDTETYPFLLQKLIGGYRINNYALPGVGMAANFVRITQQIPVDSGSLVVYAYIESHDFKTNNANRKIMYPSRNFLKDYYFLYLTESLKVVRTQYDYKPWPFIQYSAFLNFLEDRYLAFRDDLKSKHQASKNAVSYLNEFCKKRKAHFLFVILQNDETCMDMLSYCKRSYIDCADVSVDISNNKYNLKPHDDHPNFEANKIYSKKIYEHLLRNNLITN